MMMVIELPFLKLTEKRRKEKKTRVKKNSAQRCAVNDLLDILIDT